MKRESETEHQHQPNYISSFAQNFHEQEVQEANKNFSRENSLRTDKLNLKYSQTENTKNQTTLFGQQQTELKKLSIRNLNSQELKIFKRVEQKIGRALNHLEEIDAIEHIIYEPDRTLAWLDEESAMNTEQLLATTPERRLNHATESIAVEIENLNLLAKVTKAVKQAVLYLPLRTENKLKNFLASKILAAVTGLLCILTVSQFLIASKLANQHSVSILVILPIGVFIIWKFLSTFKDLIGFANVVNATTEKDIDRSGKHLAAFVSAFDMHLVLSLFIKNNKH